jgi:acid phosphatase (class A)
VSLRDGLTVFRCAVGVTLDRANAPRLMTLLAKTQINTGQAVEATKNRFRRPRPYAGREAQARTCLAGVTPDQLRRGSTSYPGGHSSLGMAWGLILAELAPDRTGEIMSRVQDFSYSRLVCGIHYPSDLAAGETLGAALVARLHADPAFRADLEAARAEIAAVRRAQTAPPAACAAS